MTTTSDLGELVRDGDRVSVTFTRRLAHPVDKVWRAVTEPEHLAAWFPDGVEGTMAPGARLRFAVGDDGSGGFDGEVLEFEPPSRLALRWGTDRLHIELRPEGGGTVLTFTDTFDEVGKAARDAAGWHECLGRLDAHLDGAPVSDAKDAFGEAHSRYVEAFPAEAATIGPPPGWAD
jgi:uncharacterized protein YndB with AHSA1/START domain